VTAGINPSDLEASAVSRPKRVGHYVASAHWDREWYERFQDYRFRLVRMLDELLDTMEAAPQFRYFQSDGQSILWEDYLAVRPEREETVRRLAGEGRLRIGPWYVLTDEFLVSGESLIRNLQQGLAVASRFGAPARVGFVSDLFGHTSQLPQILRGFHIDNAFLWRGVNESTHGAIFRWRAPDGSEVLAYRFSPLFGYGLYAEKVRTISQPDAPVTMDSALEGLSEVIDIETDRCPTDAFLIFDGADHMEIEPLTVDLLAKANATFKDVQIIHSHLEGFVEDLREQKDWITAVHEGELREPGELGDDGWLIAGVLSSRMPLKQANARCETELCAWAEPFATFAAATGGAYPRAFLELAWKYLLRNHPHDSICACSLDSVHRDMMYRFEQAESIAAHVTGDALAHLAARIETADIQERDIALTVFNPSTEPLDQPIDMTIRFPAGIDAIYQEFFGYEPKVGFRLYDPQGRELAYQYVNQRQRVSQFRRRKRKLPAGETRHEVDVTVPLQVPALGYTRVVCRPVREPTRYLGSMAVDDHTITNGLLTVAVRPNGTLDVTDLVRSQRYTGLLTLEDCADIADGWHRGIPVNDQISTSHAARADVALVADGIAKATLRIRVALELPECFLFDQMIRSVRTVPFVVTHEVTLRKDVPYVEVHTFVDNNIRDHRLRVLLPTGTEAATYLADAAFDVIERPIALRPDNARLKELELETKPQFTWTAVHDDARGLAVVTRGLPESAVRDQPARPIALTLLRAFAKTPFTGGEPGGQIQGRHAFDYLLVPVAGPPDVAALCRLGQRLAAGARTVQLDDDDRRYHAREGVETHLPPTRCFLEVEPGDAVVTAVLPDADSPPGKGLRVRLFNPTREAIEAAIHPASEIRTVSRLDLEGREIDTLPAEPGRARVQLGPKQLQTVRIVMR